MSAVPSSRSMELENSRLGVIYFLGNLRVDFSPEDSTTEMKNKALKVLKGKVGDGKIVAAANKVGGAVEAVDKKVDEIALSIRKWLVRKFHFSESDAELAIQHVRYNLPPLINDLQGEVKKTASSFGVTDMASGLYTAATKAMELYDLHHDSEGVILESGHPDLIAESIKRSVRRDLLAGLGEAALAGAKAALAAFTGGAGLIINKVAGVIELILKFAVRFCDALSLRKVFDDARKKWTLHKQSDAIQKRADDFADWFKKTVDSAPVVAALVMNCGIAGDAMRFLQVITSGGVVMTQGQFDKGVTYLNTLKKSASDLIGQIQEDMRIWSPDQLTSALLKQAQEKGLVIKEAGSSWRSKIFGWSNQNTKFSQALNWALDKAGYKQSAVFARL